MSDKKLATNIRIEFSRYSQDLDCFLYNVYGLDEKNCVIWQRNNQPASLALEFANQIIQH